VTVTGPAGYEGGAGSITVVAGETGVLNFELRETFTYNACVTTPMSIPDNNTAGIFSNLLVPVGGDVADVHVSVNITHTWRGDLIVELISPMGTTVRLHNRTGSSADNIITSYDDLTQESGPGNLDDFNGQSVTGTWRLRVSDNASLDVGTLNNWCLTLLVTQEGAVPVAVSAFSAENAEQGVALSWRVSDPGDIAGFDLVRRVNDGPAVRLNSQAFEARSGQFDFLDRAEGVEFGSMLSYELRAVDAQGARTLVATSALKYTPALPKVYALEQNRPNPFNPRTTIEFALPQAGRTRIRIYDVAGRVVATLRDESLTAGRHTVEWSGTDSSGHGVSTGVYYYEIVSRNFRDTKRMTLVK
jgi:subtilisin-like proprotein convertase family protein